MRRSRQRRVLLGTGTICAALAAGLGMTAEHAVGRTFVVSTARDQGAGSLRAAVQRSNEARGRDRIEFEARLPPVQVRRDLVLRDGVTIDGGPGRQSLVALPDENLAYPRMHAKYQPERGRLALRRITTRSLGLGGSRSGYQVPVAIRDSAFLSRSGKDAGTAIHLTDNGQTTISRSTIRGWSLNGVYAYSISGEGFEIADTVIAGNAKGIRVYNVTGRLENVEIRGNQVGVDTTEGHLSVVESTISGNTGGGGIDATYDNHGYAHPYGGGRVSVRRSTIANNQAPYGGGISMSHGSLDVLNSTISGNRASGSAEDPGHGRGGGIYADYGHLEVTASTISGNAAAEGGGMSIRGPQNRIVSSIVAGNEAASGGECAQIEAGRPIKPVSEGANVFGLAGCGVSKASDFLTDSPGLEPLANNGGPTPTHALRPNSPAIDHGRRLALQTDQRGVRRGRNPDSGSFERR